MRFAGRKERPSCLPNAMIKRGYKQIVRKKENYPFLTDNKRERAVIK